MLSYHSYTKSYTSSGMLLYVMIQADKLLVQSAIEYQCNVLAIRMHVQLCMHAACTCALYMIVVTM